MAHMIDISTGRAAMAFVGPVPWHGLGQELDVSADVDEWAIAAGMDFHIHRAPLKFKTDSQAIVTVPDKVALYRADTDACLSVVGADYKIVQPREVLEFFRDLTADAGFQLETAGVLFDGRRYWALANIGAETRIRGVDRVKGYLLLATSCDGSMATTAQFTSIRVVCNNTLTMSMGQDSAGAVKVRHRSVFRPEEVKRDLGLDVWREFEAHAEDLAATSVDFRDKALVKDFLVHVFEGKADAEFDEQPNKRAMKATWESVLTSPGSQLPSAKNTAWGLLNGVTHYVDFKRPVRGDNADSNRFAAAQFGVGAKIKERALDFCLKLAA